MAQPKISLRREGNAGKSGQVQGLIRGKRHRAAEAGDISGLLLCAGLGLPAKAAQGLQIPQDVSRG
jgi:hypothetical protein